MERGCACTQGDVGVGAVCADADAIAQALGRVGWQVLRLRMSTSVSAAVSCSGEFEVRHAPDLGGVVEFRSLLRSSNPGAQAGLAPRAHVQLVGIA